MAVTSAPSEDSLSSTGYRSVPIPGGAPGTIDPIAPQSPQHATIGCHRIFAFRCLDDLDERVKSALTHDPPKRVWTKRSLSNEFMSVSMRPEGSLGIIEMQAPQVLESDNRVPCVPDVVPRVDEVVSCSKEMTCVRAESNPSLNLRCDPQSQLGEFLETTPQRGPAPSRGFQQNVRPGHLGKRVRVSFGVADQATTTRVDEVAGVRNHELYTELATALELTNEALK